VFEELSVNAMTKQLKNNKRRQSARGAVRQFQAEKKKFSVKMLFIIVSVFIVGIVYADFHYKRWIASAIAMPVRTVQIKSQYKFVEREKLENVLKDVVVGNFFEVNLASF